MKCKYCQKELHGQQQAEDHWCPEQDYLQSVDGKLCEFCSGELSTPEHYFECAGGF